MPWARRITFVEPIIDAAIATLNRDLAAAIAAFNAEGGVTTLPDVASVIFGAADPLILVAGPVVEVAAPTGETGTMSVERSEFDHDVRVNVCVWHEGQAGDLEKTYRESLGLGRVVIEVLCQDAAFGTEVEIPDAQGVVWRADVIPEDPTDDGREFRKWRVPVLIQFRLETVERFQA